MLCSGGLRHPAFRLVKAGERLELGDYATDIPWRPVPFTGTIDVPGAISRRLRRRDRSPAGAPPHASAAGRRSAGSSKQSFGQPVQANAYFTPRGSQGLPVHHDTHDVFCLQVAGRKRWLVYEPALELPLRNQRYRPELGEPGEPVLDLVLEPGDMLYMPRGWLHEALTSDEDSLHLTIGVSVYTWLDALRAALERARTSSSSGARCRTTAWRLPICSACSRRGCEPDDVVRRRRSKLVRTRRPVLEDALSELRASDALTAETPLERRPTVLFELEDGALVFEGKRVRVPERAVAELRAVAESEWPVPGGRAARRPRRREPARPAQTADSRRIRAT